MTTGKLILLLALAAAFVVAAATAICAVLGSQREQTEKWARNGFVASLGTILLAAVIVLSSMAIHALNHIELTDTSDAQRLSTVDFGATGEKVSSGAVAQTTPEPGTVIRDTPTPEPISGVNYGAEFGVETCNDYVYFTQTSTVYTGPGTEYETMGSVTAGGTLSRVGKVDGWSLIDYNGNFGFVSDDTLIQTE